MQERMLTMLVRCLLFFALLFVYSCVEEQKSPVGPTDAEHIEKPSLSVQSTPDLWIYLESLNPPWLNMSWSASIDFNSTDYGPAGNHSIKTTLTGAWGALSVHHGTWGSQGIDPSSYTDLQFTAYSPTPGTRIAVLLENDAGQSFTKVTFGTIPAEEWMVVSIPMSQLNPNGQTINRVDIQEVSGGMPTFYVDSLRFIGAAGSGTPPPAPTPASPANGATAVTTDPTLSWNASDGAASYRVQISTGSSFASTVADQGNITATSYSADGLSNNTTYYWRVNASNSSGTSDWSSVFSFTTADAPPPSQDVTALWVYQESLEAPWTNASWNVTTTYNSTEFAHAGSNSIKVQLMNAWGALSVHHGSWGSPGIDPTSFTGLEFAAYTASPGARLSVLFENDAGQSFPSVAYGTIPTGQWTIVSIPMSQLNPNGQVINRIDIQDISGGTPTFYVDSFRFVGSETSGSPPVAPTLSSPANGSTGVATNPTLSWNASDGAASYRLQLSTSSGFSSTVVDQSNITGTSYSASGLSSSTTYYWRVNASNGDGTSDWSSVFSFTTTAPSPPPSAPTLVSPANGATGVATNPTLSWNASDGAISYRLQVSTGSGFSSTVVDQSSITGTSYSANGLSSSTTYYWRVNASNSDGTSDWSSVFSFTTAASPPPPEQAPDLTVDANRIRSTLQVQWRSFSSSSCAVVEGCASPGSRKLLRFEVTVPNFGTADVVFGRPEDHPELFIWSDCHDHYHFEQFAEYRLLNASDQRVVIGRKQAFCLLDSRQYWSGYPSQGYDCDYQGISVGWADVYGRSLDCQWLDITDIPAGDYIVEVEVNIGGFINEGANTHPNIVRVPVRIQ